MKRLKHLLRQSELHVMLFFMGFAVLSWPLLSLLHLKRPAVVLIYLLSIWVLAILLLFLLSRSCAESEDDEHQDKGKSRDA